MLLLCRVMALCILLCAMLTFPADMQAAPLAQDASVRLSCRIEPATLPLNGEATLVIEIADVQNLYGYELDLSYDENLIQMQDADPNQSGTNSDLADKFLIPDFVVKNFAESGSLSIVLTQLAPNVPKSGSGELARISFVGTAAGFANFAFGKVVFSDNNGLAIPLMAEDCPAEIGSSGAPTPTPTLTPTPLPSLTPTPTLTATPVTLSSPTPDTTLVAGANAASPTATHTPVPPTALPTNTFTPASQGAAPTEISPTATFTLIPPIATETPTQFVPPTATVLVISTPIPVIDSSVGGDPRAQEQLPPPVPTDPVSAPMATPSVVVNDALVDGVASPTVTSLPPTAQTFTDSVAISSPAEAPSAVPTLAQEALSPPEVTQESPEASVDPTESASVVDALVAASTVAPSPTPTATPLLIAQAEARPPRAKIVVDQPEPVRPLIQGEVLRIAAWITLLCASLLALFAWRLRRS